MIELDNKKQALLNKLRALAERGIGGERENAQRKLEAILQRYEISAEEFEANGEKSLNWFTLPKFQKLFLLIAAEVLDVDPLQYRKFGRTIGIESTPAQAVEIELTYAAYRRSLEREIEELKEAFFLRHGLYVKATRPLDEKYGRDRTINILRMADRMTKTQVHKELE
jgi:hypothetical protein